MNKAITEKGAGEALKRDKESGGGGRPKGLRMSKLTEATGLPKSAILHYLSLGLLPQPVKTSRNMAYYDPACVERIRFIRSMQESYSMPLGKIGMLLSYRDEGRDITPLLELNEAIFAGNEEPDLDRKDYAEASGLDDGQVEALLDGGLLVPLEEGRFNRYDVMVGIMYARGFAMGLTISDLAFYSESAKRIVDEEMALRRKLTSHLPEEDDMRMTAQLVRGARAMRNYVIDRTFQRRVMSYSDLKGEGGHHEAS